MTDNQNVGLVRSFWVKEKKIANAENVYLLKKQNTNAHRISQVVTYLKIMTQFQEDIRLPKWDGINCIKH